MDVQNQETTKKKKVWKPRPRYMGVVTRWDKKRKFGFIRCYEDGETYFAHCTQLTDDYELIRDSVVEFEIWQSKQEPDKYYAAKILICEVPEQKRKNKNKVVTN